MRSKEEILYHEYRKTNYNSEPWSFEEFKNIINDEDMCVSAGMKATYAAMEEYSNEQKKPLIEALRKIANWELPSTGEFWPSGDKMSYEAAYGSNGARAYFKKLANDALINELNKPHDTI